MNKYEGNMEESLSPYMGRGTSKNSFTCDICGKKPTCKNDLKKHIMTHESNPDLRYLFICDICGKKSTCKSHLMRHIMTHESNPHLRF